MQTFLRDHSALEPQIKGHGPPSQIGRRFMEACALCSERSAEGASRMNLSWNRQGGWEAVATPSPVPTKICWRFKVLVGRDHPEVPGASPRLRLPSSPQRAERPAVHQRLATRDDAAQAESVP